MITFEIVFVDNDEKKPSFIVEPSGEGKGKITIKNHNNNLGIGSLEPVPVAEDGNYKLFFSYKVFGNSTEPLARLFVYSFYMEGD